MFPNMEVKKLSEIMGFIGLLTMLSLCKASLPPKLLTTFVKSFRAPKPIPIFNDIPSESKMKLTKASMTSLVEHTLKFLIRVLHFLFFFEIFSYLHGLNRTYTFIYFWEKFPPSSSFN